MVCEWWWVREGWLVGSVECRCVDVGGGGGVRVVFFFFFLLVCFFFQAEDGIRDISV